VRIRIIAEHYYRAPFLNKRKEMVYKHNDMSEGVPNEGEKLGCIRVSRQHAKEARYHRDV
jgi:hypothetical protein